MDRKFHIRCSKKQHKAKTFSVCIETEIPRKTDPNRLRLRVIKRWRNVTEVSKPRALKEAEHYVEQLCRGS